MAHRTRFGDEYEAPEQAQRLLRRLSPGLPSRTHLDNAHEIYLFLAGLVGSGCPVKDVEN